MGGCICRSVGSGLSAGTFVGVVSSFSAQQAREPSPLDVLVESWSLEEASLDLPLPVFRRLLLPPPARRLALGRAVPRRAE